MTCVAWVFCRSRNPFASIAKNRGAHHGGALHFGPSGDGNDLQVERDGGATAPGADKPDGVIIIDPSDQPFPVDRWVDAAFTTDGRAATLYRDGVGVTTEASRPIATQLPDAVAGESPGDGFKTDDTGAASPAGTQVGYCDARIAGLALLRRAVLAEEIRRLADAAPQLSIVLLTGS